jgi:hypothetical protein
MSQSIPDRLDGVLSTRITSAFRELLTSKHLYQSVQLDTEVTGIKEIEDAVGNVKASLMQGWLSQLESNWIADDPARRSDSLPLFSSRLRFCPPDIKTFCKECDGIEAFNLSSAEDLLARGGSVNVPLRSRKGATVQVFALSYVCQSCKSIPEVFLVRRDGHRLTLSGRTPIEHVAVPSDIPKVVSRFYSSAVVARQSGQTLAANFFLRTVVEQFSNSKTSAGTADESIEQYMDALPKDFRARFPSFRDIYGVLSSDIHSAIGSSEVFDHRLEKVVKHFKARRLFELE